MNLPIIETKRLVLRKLTNDDSEAVYEYLSDPEVIRDLEGYTESLEEAEGYIDWCNKTLSDGTDIRWGIEEKATGKLIGDCGFGKINEPRIPTELGYMLSQKAWGKGYMSEVLDAILVYGFGELGLHRIQAWVCPHNTASVRLLQKNGFIKEGHLREYVYQWYTSKYLSVDLYSLLANDYKG